MYQMTSSKRFININCSLKPKQVGTKHVENHSFVSGEGRGKWQPFRFWRWVFFISRCSDAIVTSPKENKSAVPGRLTLYFPAVLLSLPISGILNGKWKWSKAEPWCDSAMEKTRCQNLLIWARGLNPPYYVALFCCISRGNVLWATALFWFLISKKWRKGEGNTLSWKIPYKLIGFPRSGEMNWDLQLNPLVHAWPAIAVILWQVPVRHRWFSALNDHVVTVCICCIVKVPNRRLTRPKSPPVCVYKILK